MREEESIKNPVEINSETQLLFQLLKCSHFIEREINNILHSFGLKQQQFAVLSEIIWNGPISQKELGENLLFEKSNISRIVKLLSERKLVQVTNSSIDRRLTLLIETPEGFSRWSQCLHVLNGMSADYIPTLSREDIRETFKKLKQLEKSFNVKRKKSG